MPAFCALRERQKRNFLATLLLSQGVPMLLAGDEVGRTQRGNNNAYCQDNEISWIDWELDAPRQSLLEFTRRLVALRSEHPAFRRRDFFQGRPLHGVGVKDLVWLRPDGQEMSDEEWEHEHARCLGVHFSGAAVHEVDRKGRTLVDDDFLLLFNAHHDAVAFVVPSLGDGAWHRCSTPSANTRTRNRAGSAAARSTRSRGARWPCSHDRRSADATRSPHALRHRARPDGSTRFRLWAPGANGRRSRCAWRSCRRERRGAPGGADAAPRGRLARVRGAGVEAWGTLPLPPARRSRRSRSGLALQSGRRARGERPDRSPCLCLAQQSMARTALARVGDLRTARRHVHAAGHVRRRRASASRTWPLSA